MKYGTPYNSDPAAAREVLDAIRRIVQVLRVGSRAAERDVGLSAAQLFVLERLAGANQPLSVNELAERTLTHQSSVSVVVQRLQGRGLIERVRSSQDGRRAELSLTPAAKKLLGRAPAAAQDRIISAVNAMPHRDRRMLATLLGKLAAEVGGDAVAPAMFFEDQQSRKGSPRART